MKYIFLAFTIDRAAGSQRYVNNKVNWLKEQGWDVVVFDHHGGLVTKDNIVLDNLKQFKDNRFYEFFFPPSYFSKKKREEFISTICNVIGPSDDYVIESNSSRLALWGELLSQRLHAKHLLLFVDEHPTIRSEKEFKFLSFKFDRRELFLISAKTAISLFSDYRSINDEEANNHVFAAVMNVKAQDVPMPEIEDLPHADYKILSFGRQKNYFENMFRGVCEFANKHNDKKINFICMGVDCLPVKITNMLNSCPNIFFRIIPFTTIIPKVLFEYSDVVIATAGCANISFREGAKTISMNVETCQPLGVMGYTTINSVTNSNGEENNTTISSILEDVLIKKSFTGEYWLYRKPSGKGYPFQLSLINDDRIYWKGITDIVQDKPLRRFAIVLALRFLGIKHFVEMYRSLFLKQKH